MAVGVWPVVFGQGSFYLVGRSWVTWWRRLGVAAVLQFLGLVVVVSVVLVVLWVRPLQDQVVDLPVIVNNCGGGRCPCCFHRLGCTSLRFCSDAVRGGRRPCGAGRRRGCCPALGQSRCLLRQCGTEGGLTLSGWVGAHHTGDELN